MIDRQFGPGRRGVPVRNTAHLRRRAVPDDVDDTVVLHIVELAKLPVLLPVVERRNL